MKYKQQSIILFFLLVKVLSISSVSPNLRDKKIIQTRKRTLFSFTSPSPSSPSTCPEVTPFIFPFIFGVCAGAILACIPVCYTFAIENEQEEVLEGRRPGLVKRSHSTINAANQILRISSSAAEKKKKTIAARKHNALSRLNSRLDSRKKKKLLKALEVRSKNQTRKCKTKQ
jgi:hypothetical protein